MATIYLKATGGVNLEAAGAVVAQIDPTLFRQSRFAAAEFFAGAALDTLVYQARTLAARASEDLNLGDGSLLDFQNAAAAFATLKLAACILVGGAGLVVGNAAANPHPLWFGSPTHTAAVDDPSSPPFLVGSAAGRPVTPTAKAVRVANSSAAPLTYLLVLAGLKP